MQTPTRVELIAYAVALIIVAIVHVLPWIAQTCDQVSWTQIMATSGPSCAEFWVNRYQSLIGNMLTAAVAGVTLVWISRQLKVTQDQLEMGHRELAASAAASTRVIAAEHEDVLSRFHAIGEIIVTIRTTAQIQYSSASLLPVLTAMRTRSSEIRQALWGALEILQKIQRQTAIGPVYQTTGKIGKALAEMFAICQEADSLNAGAPGSSLKQTEINKQIGNYRAAFGKIDLLGASAIELNNEGIEASFDQISQTWLRVRQFDQKATQPLSAPTL